MPDTTANKYPSKSTNNIQPQIFPGEVFAKVSDFDTGIRQLLPRYDEMLNVIVQCLSDRSSANVNNSWL